MSTNRYAWIFRLLLAALVCALLSQMPAAAQSTFGIIIGTVMDPSGAVVAGASVEAMNQATGAVRQGMTDAEGNYRFLNLDPGTYSITVTIPPFSTQKNQNVLLPARETVRSD